MTAIKDIVTVSWTHNVGSFGWRHRLTWHQLSVLWQICVSHRIPGDMEFSPERSGPCSFALAHGEYDPQLLELCAKSKAPKVIFLDRFALHSRGGEDFGATYQPHHSSSNKFCHVFRVHASHSLTAGLPTEVSIYGACPIVTPLRIDDGMDILVSLEDVPVIAKRGRDLVVGADPWQLGAPSVPMVYKILSNWLRSEVGLNHRILEPYAAIRLDDLPTTAEEIKRGFLTRRLDKQRCRTIRRLRKFCKREGCRFTVMYSSHYHGSSGSCNTIASEMPRSINELKLGVEEDVFEIGSHGMVHLRNGVSDPGSMDPREFLDLDEEQTSVHLTACANEIARLFQTSAKSFVAPAWGYRPGVTKEIAAKAYPVIVDSSQHVESGECSAFLEPEGEGKYLNAVETFRTGERMLSYNETEFWQCYAGAGIPIHYMQHTDGNWHLLRSFLAASRTNRIQSRLLAVVQEASHQAILRAVCAALLCFAVFLTDPKSAVVFWKLLTSSSIYSFARAMKIAGYERLTLAEFIDKIMNSGQVSGDQRICHGWRLTS